MAIDPNIALGVRPIEIASPLAQYGQVAQIQNAQNQNALAQYQLGSAQRQESTQNALSDAYKAAYNPETGAIDNSLLMRGLAERGAGHLIPDVQTKMLATQKEQGLIKKTNVETTGLEFDQKIKKANKAISDIAALNTAEEAIASIDRHLASGDIDQQKADMLKGQLTQAPSFDAWQNKMLVGILDAKGKLDQQKITTKDTDRGGYIERQTYDAQGRPVGLPTQLPKTATIGEKTAQGQLSLAQQKFAFEKANPGYELKEDADGNFFGVNKRTLQAIPVTVGGGAVPTAAPVAGAGMPGPRVAQPNAAVQTIPGMTSVLDQTMPAAAPTAGGPRQLVGKAKEAPAKFHDIDLQLSGLAGSLKSFKDEIKKEPTTGAALLPKGADTARMQAKYTALLMGLKDLYTLGALTGPDMSIIESQINNPASWAGKLATYKGIKEQTKVIEDMLDRSTQNLENTYGRKPNATLKAMQPLKNVPGGSDSDPLGILKGKP